jgi:hypothetical protein
MKQYIVNTIVFNNSDNEHTMDSAEEHLTFTVDAEDLKQAELMADDYTLTNYGQECYNVNTTITEVK